jgi:hypothetical protein
MKTFIICLFLLATTVARAQEEIHVILENRASSKGILPAFEVMVPQATTREALDLLKKYLTPPGLFKRSPRLQKVKDEWLAANVLIDEIAPRPVNTIIQVSSFPGHIYVRLFFETENGFIGADSTAQTETTKNYVRNYGVELYLQAVEKELKNEEKKLRSLERDLNQLVRKNKNFRDKREDAEQDEQALKKEARDQREMLNSNRLILGENPDATRETTKDELKDTEKEIKKARRSASRFDRKTRKNLKDQNTKVQEIEQQRIRVEEVAAKLSNIR